MPDEPTQILSRPLRRIRQLYTAVIARPHTTYLILATVFGLLMVVMLPPFMVPDEDAHLFHAYHISQGHLVSNVSHGSTGGVLPDELTDAVGDIRMHVQAGGTTAYVPYHKYLSQRLDKRHAHFVPFDTTAVYSPIAYLPQVIGITFAKLIYPSPLVLLYGARLCNLAAFITMMWLAIRLVPIKKWLFVAIGLMPMTIQQTSSASSDVMTLGTCLVAVAFTLHLAVRRKPLDRQAVLWSLLVAVVLGLTKQVNALAILPMLCLPAVCFRSLRRRIYYSAALLGAAFGSAIVWYGLTKVLHYNFSYSGNPLVNMTGQLHSILHAPLVYLRALINSYVFNISGTDQTPDFYWTSLAGYFSWFTYRLPIINIVMVYFGLMVALISVTPATAASEKLIRKLWALRYSLPVAGLAIILATGTLLYLVWTPVAATTISGVQGRYFLPAIAFFATLFIGKRWTVLRSDFAVGSIVTSISLANFITMALLTLYYFNVLHFATRLL